MNIFRMIRKLTNALRKNQEDAIARSFSTTTATPKSLAAPLALSLDDELVAAAKDLERKKQDRLSAALKDANLEQYKIKGSDESWAKALSAGAKAKSLVSVKSGEKRAALDDGDGQDVAEMNGHKSKKNKKSKDSKKNKSR